MNSKYLSPTTISPILRKSLTLTEKSIMPAPTGNPKTSVHYLSLPITFIFGSLSFNMLTFLKYFGSSLKRAPTRTAT